MPARTRRERNRPSTTRTTPTTSWSSRGSRRSASGRACTSAPPTPAGSCTACGRSSTTRVDEALAGRCTRIEVILHPDGSVEVHDDGRGIPVDKEPKTGLLRRRGGLHQAARRRQVRRRLVRRHRRPARRRRLGGQRAVGAARRRGRPVAGHPGRCRSSAAPRASSTATGPTATFTPQSGPAQGRPGQEGRDRHPDPVLAGPADLHQGRDVRLRRAGHPGPADVVHRARASSW